MTEVPTSAFPDPDLRRAAAHVLNNQPTEAIAAARESRGGIDLVGPERDTLLLLAVRTNNRSMVDALLRAGANPSIPADRAPLAVAAEKASTEIVAALLRAHAKPDGVVQRETALWRAALVGRLQVAELLLQAGANVDLPNQDGFTPAMAAVQAINFRMALLLLQHGASPFAVSLRGETVGYWAEDSTIPSRSVEGQAREAFIEAIRKAGHPWPPPAPKAVLAARAAGKWPPR